MEHEQCLDCIPEEILRHIASFLSIRDVKNLSFTCVRLKRVLPSYKEIRGPDLRDSGPSEGHWTPELYFGSPRLTSPIQRLIMSMKWKDQVREFVEFGNDFVKCTYIYSECTIRPPMFNYILSTNRAGGIGKVKYGYSW